MTDLLGFSFVSFRFEKKVNPRKFKGYVTDVEISYREANETSS